MERHLDGQDALELPINLQDTEGVDVQLVNNETTSQSVSSLTLTTTSDLPETDQEQNHEVKLANPCEHGLTPAKSPTLDESSDQDQTISKIQHCPSDSMGCCVRGQIEGKDNEAFVEDDDETSIHHMQEKESVDQELSESVDNDPDVVKSVNGDTLMSSASLIGGQPEGRDNEAFIEDSILPKQENEMDSANVIDETNLQFNSSQVVPNMYDVCNDDSDQQSIGLKEGEETKSAGTVTWRLYWKYFKEGLPVSRIVLLAVALLFAQGKNNFFCLSVYVAG